MNFFKNSQPRILILIHRLNGIIYYFTSSFLVLYMLKITKWNLKSISLYYIASYISITLGFWLLSFIISKHNILKLFKLGIVGQAIFLYLIMYLGKNIVNYMILIGIIKGIFESFYWLPRHYLIFRLNKSSEAKKFYSTDAAIKKVQGVLLPILMGGIVGLNEDGYGYMMIIMIIVSIIGEIAASWLKFDDEDVESFKLSNLKELFKNKHWNKIRRMYFSISADGFTRSGILVVIISSLIYIVYETEFAFGAFKSIFALVSSVILFLLGKYVKDKKFEACLIVSGILVILAMSSLVFEVNATTLIIYTLTSEITFSVIAVISQSNMVRLIRHSTVKKYTLESILLKETSINTGRVIGFTVLYFVNNITINSNSLKSLLIYVVVFESLMVIELIRALSGREPHVIHGIKMFKYNIKFANKMLKKN